MYFCGALMRSLNRRQFLDLSAHAAKVGGFMGIAAALHLIPGRELARKLLGNGDAPPHYIARLLEQWDLQAEAATLPLNYVSQPFLVVPGADMRNGIAGLLSQATESGDGTYAATDNVTASLIKNGGSKNIRMDVTGGTISQVGNMVCTLSPLVMDQVPTLGVRVWLSGAGNLMENYYSHNAGITQYARFQTRVNSPGIATISSGWTFVNNHRDEWIANPSLDYQNDFVRLLTKYGCSAGGVAACIWDQFYYNGYESPKMAFIFEGGSDTHYSTVFGIFQARGLVGTLAIPTSVIGTAGFMTWDNINEMVSAGWAVMIMGDLQTTGLTGLSVSASTARISGAEAQLTANVSASQGIKRAVKHLALPGNTFGTSVLRTDTNLETALMDLSYLSALEMYQDGFGAGNASNGEGIDPHYGISLNKYRVQAHRFQNPDTLTEASGHLTHLVRAGGIKVLRSSKTVAGSVTSGELDANFLTELLDGRGATVQGPGAALLHHAGTISVLTWPQLYGGLSGRTPR